MEFVRALARADDPVIMEVKTRSADGTDLLRGRSAGSVVAEYTAAGAACVSVVTGNWFGGDRRLVDEVVAAADVPVLWKDFFTRPSQLVEAQGRGVAAVLLTVGILVPAMVARLVDRCLEVGLTPFVEVATEHELRLVPRPAEAVMAVNNKNIGRREVGAADLDRSRRLLASLRSVGTPCPVSASGIADAAVAAELLDLGYGGLLIGTGLLTSDDPARFMDRLRRNRNRHRQRSELAGNHAW